VPARHAVPDSESPLALKRRARRINRILAETYPDAHIELDFTTPLELVVATILSAQCTDARVNLVTPKLFATYRSAADYAAAERAELEQLIQSTGFFRAKTNALIGLGQALVERYHGEVPARLDVVGVGQRLPARFRPAGVGQPDSPPVRSAVLGRDPRQGVPLGDGDVRC